MSQNKSDLVKPHNTSKGSKTDKKKPGGFSELVRTLVIAGLIAVGFRSLIAEPFNIPSGSMIPTLLVGDYLFVSKFSYGYSRYSFPFGIAPIEGRLAEGMPQRGDVVVFRLPADTSVDYIKRVVGLPGDEIQVKAGILHINGEAATRRVVGEETTGDGVLKIRATQYEETFPDGHSHIIQEIRDDLPNDQTVLFKVPEGHYFMMGDNRDNSRDSRTAAVGFVPAENLIGKAQFLFFSTDGSAGALEFWRWPFAIRYGRLGQAIQ